jgi:hypothetical protein
MKVRLPGKSYSNYMISKGKGTPTRILVWLPINIYALAGFWVVGNTHIKLNEDHGRSRNCFVRNQKETTKPKII